MMRYASLLIAVGLLLLVTSPANAQLKRTRPSAATDAELIRGVVNITVLSDEAMEGGLGGDLEGKFSFAIRAAWDLGMMSLLQVDGEIDVPGETASARGLFVRVDVTDPPMILAGKLVFQGESWAGIIDFTATTYSGLAQMPVGETVDCVRGQGFWGNKKSEWPVEELTLGTVTYDTDALLEILGGPVQGNGLVSLAYQLIAAKLNQEAGVSVPTAVQDAIDDADDLIGDLVVPPVGEDPLDPDVTEAVKDVLDDFNNGLSEDGPESCDDLEEEEEEEKEDDDG